MEENVTKILTDHDEMLSDVCTVVADIAMRLEDAMAKRANPVTPDACLLPAAQLAAMIMLLGSMDDLGQVVDAVLRFMWGPVSQPPDEDAPAPEKQPHYQEFDSLGEAQAEARHSQQTVYAKLHDPTGRIGHYEIGPDGTAVFVSYAS